MKGYLRIAAAAAALLIWLPVQALAAEGLIPVGRIIGLQLGSDTITVVAYDDVLGGGARQAGLQIGDQLVKIDATPITQAQDVQAALEGSEGPVEITVRRDGSLSTLRMTPEQTRQGPRLGVYLRQGIAGIGTVTYYDPGSGVFGTLGHGVSDAQGNLAPMTQGNAYPAVVQSVKKGRSGDPGQLKGVADPLCVSGILLRNTPQGVFGVSGLGWQGQAVPVASVAQIHPGPAVIRATVAGDVPRDYSVEILKIYPEARADSRNMLLKVTDPALLEATGGIVQGMSGSPILQDGMLVGAVTHVLVSDPTRGYGIFIENMLSAAS